VGQHTGGDAILNNAGADSSVGFHGGTIIIYLNYMEIINESYLLFADQHPEKVADLLWEFYIGELKN
jgi:hypothetical protein